jgi:hypothetical protein
MSQTARAPADFVLVEHTNPGHGEEVERTERAPIGVARTGGRGDQDPLLVTTMPRGRY